MTLKVIQWATGSIGSASLECIIEHADLELVGCYVHSEAKVGKDVGELIGREPIGVLATNSVDEIVAMEADAVMYSPLVPRRKEVIALLKSGKNVVTPLGWFYPDQTEMDIMEPICIESGVSLHGTGMDPGAITEVLPLILSAMTSGVTFVRGEEISDIRGYASVDVVRDIMLFGATPEVAKNGPMMDLMDAGYRQSLMMITDTLGLSRESLRIERTLDVAVATQEIDTPIGVIAPGLVAGEKFYWDAYVGDHHAARVGVTWLMGEEHMDPDWNFGELGERFDIEVRGLPDTVLAITSWHPVNMEQAMTRNPGIFATAAHVVNAIPYVCAAEPGIRTSVDLPMVAGRAHSKLLQG